MHSLALTKRLRVRWRVSMPTPALGLVRAFLLGETFDPDGRVSILRASQDPGLLEYVKFTQGDGAKNAGSTAMDEHGRITIAIDDTLPDAKGLYLEELWHAVQFLRGGNVALASDDPERARREIEASRCLLDNATRLRLSDAEIAHCRTQIIAFGGVP